MPLAMHILAATDFSPASDAGLNKAAKLAATTGAKISLVHVFDPTPMAPIATRGFELADQLGGEQDLERAIQRALEDLRRSALASVTNVECRVVQASNAAQAIVGFAEDNGVDLIVVATHGRTGLAHLLIGSVTENIVRHAKCPVLTVPAAAR